MKKLLFAVLALAPSVAYAGDEAFDCSKKDGDVECKVKKDHVSVKAVTIDGGDCAVPARDKAYHKTMAKGDKFKLPGSHECNYVRAFTITTEDGKTQKFVAF
ncbi:hypothetical protein LG047_04080 [Methylocystis sp. WRRC1]|uniref:hypothetical protein n=1 Tax=Methylocystis sp. WRRC1 TaxID=1732014 RepID=UPI001D157D07|nr:hypothetical protein [Methylocystis sp. WRRC1]MCC3244507.1 hypothetical protein [Methylocystis sp. WRRC1]